MKRIFGIRMDRIMSTERRVRARLPQGTALLYNNITHTPGTYQWKRNTQKPTYT